MQFRWLKKTERNRHWELRSSTTLWEQGSRSSKRGVRQKWARSSPKWTKGRVLPGCKGIADLRGKGKSSSVTDVPKRKARPISEGKNVHRWTKTEGRLGNTRHNFVLHLDGSSLHHHGDQGAQGMWHCLLWHTRHISTRQLQQRHHHDPEWKTSSADSTSGAKPVQEVHFSGQQDGPYIKYIIANFQRKLWQFEQAQPWIISSLWEMSP